MPKIQNVGVGNYIRNPRGVKGIDSRQMNVEAMQVAENHGNAFLCFPVKTATPLVLDKTRYFMIPIDTEVEQVTV